MPVDTNLAKIAQLVKSLVLQSMDNRFDPHCRWTGFLVWAFRKPPTPKWLHGFGTP